MQLSEVLNVVAGLPTKDREKVLGLARKSMAIRPWVPNVGPQTEAYYSEADEIFYGGEAGGGKTDLGVGLALTEHKRSLIVRRINKDALKIKPRIEEILGSDIGYNGQLQRWKLKDRQIDIAGCEQEFDKQRFKGDPHDLIVFDEGTDFLEFNIASLSAGTARQTVTSAAEFGTRPGVGLPPDRALEACGNDRNALGWNGRHDPKGCASRSAITHRAGAWNPSPKWVDRTSMFSVCGVGCSRQARHATTPSPRV